MTRNPPSGKNRSAVGQRLSLAVLGTSALGVFGSSAALTHAQSSEPATAEQGESASSNAQPTEAATLSPTPWSLGDAIGLNDFLKPSKFTFSGYVDFGFTLNPASPRDRQNVGRLFDDRSNEFLLNQLGFDAQVRIEAA